MTLDRVVRITTDTEAADDRRDLAHWLSRPPEERIRHVEELRRQWYRLHGSNGPPPRLQRVARVVQLPEC
jgi:hypothetical protein